MLVSIIIPVYNVESYIVEALESIVVQNSNELEVICIDDGSTDGSGDICDSYANKYNYIHVFHKKNEGVSIARNLGLEMSTGDYIAWLDPDDCLSEYWYSSIKPYLCKHYDVVFYDYSILNVNKYDIIKYDNKSKEVSKNEFINKLDNCPGLSSVLWQKVVSKNLYNNVRFPVEVSFMEDYAILLEVITKAKSIQYISKSLYTYRIRNDSLCKKYGLGKLSCKWVAINERLGFFTRNNLGQNIVSEKLKYCYALSDFIVEYKYASMEEKRNFKNKESRYKIYLLKNMFYIVINNNLNVREKLFFVIVASPNIFYSIYRFLFNK